MYEAVVPKMGLVAVQRVSQDLLLAGGASAGGAKPRDEVVRELVTSTRREVEVLRSSDTPT